MIDVLWSDSIAPLLRYYYPRTSEKDLRRAYSYAYGGCLIQDIGYYPFGKRLFSDLAHYVRSGDFVETMVRDAGTIDELAFAIGALSHYIGDSTGHSEAVNRATALTFPKLEAEYGPIVTYEDAPVAHGRTEFGFDVAQTAWRRYAPKAYRKAIGFRVARQLLYRAFQETYGVPARGILGPARSAVASYRWSVTSLIPAFLRAQVVLLRGHLPVEQHNDARSQFLLSLSRTEYASKWAHSYSEPGIRSHLLAFVVLVIPKIGALKALATRSPTTSTEDLFVGSFNDAVAAFRRYLGRIRTGGPANLRLTNLDLDTGQKPRLGESEMVDKTYAGLVIRVAGRKAAVSPELRDHLLARYADPPATVDLDSKRFRRLRLALEKLRGAGQQPAAGSGLMR